MENKKEKLNESLRALHSAIESYPEGEEKRNLLKTFEEVKATGQDIREQSDVSQYIAGLDESGKTKGTIMKTADEAMDRFTDAVKKMTDHVKTASKAESFGHKPAKSPSVAVKEETAKACKDIAASGKSHVERISKDIEKMAKGVGDVANTVVHKTPFVKDVAGALDAMGQQNKEAGKIANDIWSGMKDLIDPNNQNKIKPIVETWAKVNARSFLYAGRVAVTQVKMFTAGAPIISLATGLHIGFISKVADKGADLCNGLLDKADKMVDGTSINKEEVSKMAGDLKDISIWAQKELIPMMNAAQELFQQAPDRE